MSFDTDVIKPGRGRVIRVDISLDNFVTVAYRYSDVAGVLDGTNQYTPRVLELGTVRRAFGQNRIAASSTTSLKLANADGGVDWICGRENITNASKARFRVYVALYDPTASTLTFTAKMLGEFVLSQWPRQDDAVVALSLADDFMGKLGAGLLLPTLADWAAVGTTANNPLKKTAGPGVRYGIPTSIGINTPIQLAFGEDSLLGFPHIIPWGNNGVGETYYNTVIVPLYCTTDTSAVSQSLVTQVITERFSNPLFDTQAKPIDGGETLGLSNVQQYYYDSSQISAGTAVIPNWKVEKSPTISKGGINFQVVYLVVRTDLGDQRYQNIDRLITITSYATGGPTEQTAAEQLAQLEALYGGHASDGGYPDEAIAGAGVAYRCIAARVTKWYVNGVPFSQRTNPPALFPIAHPVDVMTDLVSVYSSATIESVSAARVKAASPFAACAGVVSAWTESGNNQSDPPPPMSLRQVLTELAQSSDFDIFLNWSGQIAFSSDVWDFTTATQSAGLTEFLETELNDGAMRWVAANGERHAAFNRVYFEGGKRSPTTHQDVPFQGPFLLDAADIPTSTRIIEMGLRQGWRPYRQQALDPWQWRSVDGVTRDMVRFRTHIGGLRLELGMCFKLTWTRGPEIGGPYTSSIFQCESIAYAPGDDSVEIEAVWRDDTTTERQYLLDDETLLVRAKNAGTSYIIMQDSNASISISGGTDNFTTMGVAVGDIILLRDSTQAADVFTRNRALRIIAGGTSSNVIVTGDLNFGTGAGIVTVGPADWSIVRGATTYPTVGSDPTNYPSGGAMYGKATDSGGLTSDSATGNRLITG